MAKRYLARAVDRIDDLLAAATLRRKRERPALLGFLFHGIFESAAEVAADRVWPAQPLLAEELQRFVEHFLVHGYRFVRPADILAGLDPNGYYALLTFDDGYANNQRALPILRALSVPATFFVSARHVAEARCFWWDVVYRERSRRGASMASIRREIGLLKRQVPEEIETWLQQTFGADALHPVSDTDRPFTAAELRVFAADPLVTLGNHSARHADFTRLDSESVASEIREAQAYLADLAGSPPMILAYPNGAYDERSIAAARATGLRLGVTVGRQKTQLPLTGTASMTIARAFVPCGDELLPACRRSRSDVQVRRWLESLLP